MGRVPDAKNQSPLARGLLKASLVVGVSAIASGWYLGHSQGLFSNYPQNLESHRDIWRGAELGGLVARLHYWSSFVLIVSLLAALIAMFWQGDFRASKLRWFGALAMFATTLGLQITGNAIPMDRHDVRTVVVETGIAGRSPFASEQVAEFARGGNAVTEQTFRLWAEWHRMGITAMFVGALLLTLIAVIPKFTGKVDSRPEQYGVLVPIVSTGILALAFQGPTGDMAVGRDFSSGAALPSWYVLPMHVLLKLFDSIDPKIGWIGAFLIPGLVGFAVLTVPFWAKGLAEAPRRAIMMFGIMALGVIMALNGTTPAPISGEQPVADDQVASTDRIRPIDANLATLGRKVFQKNCSGCHGQDAVGGPAAPKLQGFGARIDDPVWIMRFIRHPESVRPGSPMPAIRNLADPELEAVAEYVRSLK